MIGLYSNENRGMETDAEKKKKNAGIVRSEQKEK